MYSALVKDNLITHTGYIHELFPNVLFPATGPDDAWKAENGVYTVSVFKPHDRDTEQLVSCDPYLEGDMVYTVKVEALPEERIAEIKTQKREEALRGLSQAVQGHLDSKAKEKGYDNLLSASSYAYSDNPVFQAEAQACITWRDQVWTSCFEAFKAETLPAVDALLESLPTLEWPANPE